MTSFFPKAAPSKFPSSSDVDKQTDTGTDNTSATVKPVADFSTSVTSGYAPLSVQFTDKSTGSPSTWSWDFNGDGTAESTVQNPPAYTYTTAGTYTANLTVSNANGSASKTATITVLQTTMAPIAEEAVVEVAVEKALEVLM